MLSISRLFCPRISHGSPEVPCLDLLFLILLMKFFKV
jgi:hypothetical protein